MEKKLIYYAVEHLGETFNDPVSNNMILTFLTWFHQLFTISVIRIHFSRSRKDQMLMRRTSKSL